MILRGPIFLICLTVIGGVLAGLSERLLPLGYGVTALWLGAAVIANGSIWFGGWGVLAGMLFPFLAGQMQGVDLEDSLSAVLPNLIEGLIPALAFRHGHADRALHDRRSAVLYVIWAVVVPSLCGGLVAAWFWRLLDKASWSTFRLLAFDWSLSNMVVLIAFGFPLAYLLTPALRARGWQVLGWWR